MAYRSLNVDDVLDPLGSQDPVERLMRRYGLGSSRQPAYDLPPDEADSLIQRLAHGGLSGLHAVGGLLDIGGPTVRSGLSALLGLDAEAEDPEYGLTGWDLTKAMGLEGEEGLDWSDIPSFALDIATSPLTYLSGGLTKAGGIVKKVLGKGAKSAIRKVAERKAVSMMPGVAAQDLSDVIGSVGAKTGAQRVGTRWAGMHTTPQDLLDEMIAAGDTTAQKAFETAAGSPQAWQELATEPTRGIFGVGIPGTDIRHIFGTNWANPLTKTAANVMDVAGDVLRYNPIGRIGAKLFSPEVKGASSTEGQMLGENIFDLETRYGREALGKELPFLREHDLLMQEFPKAGLNSADLDDMLYALTEQKAGVAAAPKVNETLAKLGNLAPEIQQRVRTLADDASAFYQDTLDAARQQGMYTPTLQDDMIEYAARRRAGPQAAGDWGRGMMPKTAQDYLKAREDLLRNVEGGTVSLNAMARDPLLAGSQTGPLSQAAQRIQSVYGVADPKKAEDLARYFSEALTGPGEFYMPYVSSLSRYARGAGRRQAGFEGVLDMVSKYWKPGALNAADSVPASELLVKAGGYEGIAPVPEMLDQLARRIPGWDAGKVALGLEHGILRVPRSIMDDATKIIQGFTQPEALNEVRSVIDSVNSLWRVGVTSPWIAFHVRNSYSGQIQNLINKAWDPASMFEVRAILRSGKPAPGMANWPGLRAILDAKGIQATDDEAFKVFQEYVYRNQLMGRTVNITAGVGEGLEKDLASALPGHAPFEGFAKTAAEELFGPYHEGKFNPLAARGSGGLNAIMPGGRKLIPETVARESQFAPYRIGEKASWYVEAMNRLTPTVNLLKKGWTPDAAMDFAKYLHADYAPRAFSDFENSVLRKMIPFYAYQRQMVKYIVGTLAEHPGGGLAQTIRGSAAATEGNQVLPDYLTQGAAIPISGTWMESLLGANPEGGPRILGGLSLMHESPLALLGPAAKLATGEATPFEAATETGAEMMSQMTPLVKGPIETITGKSFWQRGPTGLRDVEEQDPILGRILSNLSGQKEAVDYPGSKLLEPAIANLLAPRLFTSIRQATDPRKRAEWATEAEVPSWMPVPGAPFWSSFLGGAKIVDVSPRSQDAQIRELAQQALMDTGLGKSFERVYVPQSVRAELGPGASGEIDQLMALLNELAQRAKQRAQGGVGEPIGSGALLP